MKIFPAIDIKDKKCVRLVKGDWGHAEDYAEAMWKMMQQKKPDDYVIATGIQYSIKEFINLTAKQLDLKINWRGRGIYEKGYNEKRIDGNASGVEIAELD